MLNAVDIKSCFSVARKFVFMDHRVPIITVSVGEPVVTAAR